MRISARKNGARLTLAQSKRSTFNTGRGSRQHAMSETVVGALLKGRQINVFVNITRNPNVKGASRLIVARPFALR